MKNYLFILKNSVMKQVILLIAIAAVVSVATVGLVNSSKSKKLDATATELAQFETWKEQQAQKENAVAIAPTKTAARTTSTKRTTYSSPKMVSESSNPAQATKKKGWSKAAKGSVIGGVVGAGAGAVINKRNRAAGAVIGGILGAGGGYVIGRTMDKKDGRY